MSRKQFRSFCFTLFVEDEKDYQGLLKLEDGIRFAIWQLERASTTERLHLQGYCELERRMDLSRIKSLLGNTVHVESRKGSRKSAIDYCRKKDTHVGGPWTIGDEGVVKQGKRTDLDNLAEMVTSGAKFGDIVEEYPVQYIKYRRGIEALYSHKRQQEAKSWRTVEVLVYYGDAGTGKTRKAIEENEDFFILDQGERVWFDGYTGENCLIIDDFYGWIKYGQLLRILDGHPLRIEVKGGFTWAQWNKVVLTSNKPWEQWYPSVTDERQIAALRRRITDTKEFKTE